MKNERAEVLNDRVLFNQFKSYIKSLPLIEKYNTYEEDVALIHRARLGSIDAADILAKSVLRMVAGTAFVLGRDDDEVMELIGEGNLALWETAVKKYNPEKYLPDHVKFVTYAHLVVVSAQQRLLRKMSRPFKVSEEVELDIAKIGSKTTKFEVEFGRKPTPHELENLTGFKPVRILFARGVMEQKIISLYSTMQGNEFELMDILSDGKTLFDADSIYIWESMDVRTEIEKAIDEVAKIDARNAEKGSPTRYARTLNLRIGIKADGTWGEGLSITEVARIYGVSRDRIRQIQHQALRKVWDEKARRVMLSLLLRSREPQP